MATKKKKKNDDTPDSQRPAKKSAEKKTSASKKSADKKSSDGGGKGKAPKTPLVDDGPEEELRLGPLGNKVMTIAGGIGVVGTGAAVGLGAMEGQWAHFFHSYLVAFFWVLTIGLGALWFVTLQHLTRSEWSPVVRRIAEVLGSNIPLLAVMALVVVGPLLMGNHDLYKWANPAEVEHSHLLQKKQAYLNTGFFAARFVFYFGVWFIFSRLFLKRSVEQDTSGKPELTNNLWAVSAPGMILFALTTTFCSIDFVMSLAPEWFSTMFGVYIFAGCVVSFYSTMGLIVLWLQKNGRLSKSITVHHRHDIGKMMFAFVVFWAYIAFSQFMLIWYADIPEETVWFKPRLGEWLPVSAALLFLHFVVPFLGLLSKHVKRHRFGLGFWAVWLLVIHYVDLYWLIMPNYSPGKVPFSLMDICAWLGLGGLFLASSARTAMNLNLRPTRDPRLDKSLAFENI